MKFLVSAKHNQYLIFLIAVVLLSTVYPFFLGHLVGLITLYVLISLTLVLGIYVIHDNNQLTFWSALLGLLTLISMWSSAVLPEVLLLGLIWTLSQLSFFGLVILSMMTRVLGSQKITKDTLLASASVYFLLAILWAMIFQLIELLQPNSFVIVEQPDAPISTDVLIYLSQTTLSSVGYGDVIPMTPLARSFAALLSMSGQLYLTVLVAVLIGVYLKSGRDSWE